MLRTGLSLQLAFDEWPARAPRSLELPLRTLAQRSRLGFCPADAVAGLDGLALAHPLRSALDGSRATGGDAAELLDVAATSLDRKAGLVRSARSSVVGQRLSGRLVAGLPLAFLAFLPAGGRMLDRRGSLLLVAGAGLLLAGMWWIARLMPAPPEHDAAAELADLAAAALRAGAPPATALAVSSRALPELRAEMSACCNRVRLGASWSRSLEMAGHAGLRELAATIRRGEQLGTPIDSGLRAFASERRQAAEAEFASRSGRAPVLMVLPLVLCVLPSFALLGLAPFLRGLSLGS